MIEPQIKLLPLQAASLIGKPHKQAAKDYAATHRRLTRAAQAAVKAEEKAAAKALALVTKLAQQGLRANVTSARKNQLHLIQQYETGPGRKFPMCKPSQFGEFALLRRGKWEVIAAAVDIVVTCIRHYFVLCSVQIEKDKTTWLKKMEGINNRAWCTSDRDSRKLEQGQVWQECWYLNLVLPQQGCRCRWYLPRHLCPNQYGRGFLGEIEATGMDVQDELGLLTVRQYHHQPHTLYAESFPRYSKVGFFASNPTSIKILDAIRIGRDRDDMIASKARAWQT